MTLKPILSFEAEEELLNAAQWYEARSEGLGLAFLDQVETVMDNVGRNTLQYPVVYRDVRRALTRRFPFGVFFRVHENGRVKVIAVMHLARKPERWQRRR